MAGSRLGEVMIDVAESSQLVRNFQKLPRIGLGYFKRTGKRAACYTKKKEAYKN
jgi:hypothetical protein